MQKSDIERILALQTAAYDLLLWLNKRAEADQAILSDSNLERWRFAGSAESWVREVYGVIPQAIRPGQEDIPSFARLFSSFFQTSFRLAESAPVRAYNSWGEENGWTGSGRRKLVPGAPGGKKSARGKIKVEECARKLRLIALEELAIENEVLLNHSQLEYLEKAPELQDALILWTYNHELVRRAAFASQGEAVRSLWQAMDKKERERISADKILKARETLLKSSVAG